MSFHLLTFLEGMSICFSLSIVIGIQNAFVIKQGIRGKNSFLIAFLCSFIDAILIIIGIYGFGKFLSQHESLLWLFSWGGVLFLFGYGITAFYSAFKAHSLNINEQAKIDNIKEVIIKIITISIINPGAFLDTCVLMGSISTKFLPEELSSFAFGAIAASFVWFFSLSFGARLLKPIFENPLAWKVLDFLIGCIMFAIAISFMRTLKLGF